MYEYSKFPSPLKKRVQGRIDSLGSSFFVIGDSSEQVGAVQLLCTVYRSRIHKHTISLKFLGIIFRILRLEVSVYNVYITNKFQTTFAQEGGVKSVVEVTENSKEKNS
jgi:hypothetical protein